MAVQVKNSVTIRTPGRPALVTAILAAWLLGWLLLRGTDTLATGAAQLTGVHEWLNDLYDAVGANRSSNPLFVYFFDVIRVLVGEFTALIQMLIASPALGMPIPVLGWFGVIATAGYLATVVAGWRMGLLATSGLLLLGAQGLWAESMDTLALITSAVLIALLFAIPLGVWAGLSDRFHRLITPVLDFMQTMPTMVYLAPLTLFFLIGPASATLATLIYAAPPTIRLTAHGIRSVPPDVVEAGRSLGSTTWQQLTKVLLPAARRTIVLGINQTMMAALAMVTIAALIDAPGLGKSVLVALQNRDVGAAFNGGIAIVILAIVLDRVTTAASARTGSTGPAGLAGFLARWRLPLVIAGGVGAAVAIWYSRTYLWAARFPELGLGDAVVRTVNAGTEWVRTNFAAATTDFKNLFSDAFIDPLQALLAGSPWWLLACVIVALAGTIGGTRPAIVSSVCTGLLVLSGVWHDAMVTLTQVLLATTIVVVIGLLVGVWMGRSPRVDRLFRPVLDAGQTMPPFVYLVPFLALFEATRFTAIVAAVIYAAPVTIKIIADGIRGVSATTIEAATSAGSSSWQTITKVQLPMARRSVTLATNQGLIYVLSMVVVGGLVGGGALGYQVVAGFSQLELWGKGLASGVAIVLLGVMLDRITQAAARGSARHPHEP